MTKIISFPHMDNYYIPIYYLVKKTTEKEVIIPPKITRKTIKLGTRYSPDYICVPFKYNLGNYIEALDEGANVLLQAGGGCRYGYYAELQEQILKDLGYNFEFINLIHNNHVSLLNIYKFAKKLNKKLNLIKYIYYLINTALMIIIIDSLSTYKRQNSAFETQKNTFKSIEQKFLKELQKDKINITKQIIIYFKYKRKYKNIPLKKFSNPVKIGLVGELYSLMEPYCNKFIEEKLQNKGVEIYRLTTLTYLLFQKKYKLKKFLKHSNKYLKYHLGADATESVAITYRLAKKKYDGIIHIKSFGCTPEINAIPILEKISNDYNIPIMYLNFDSQDNETALETRIEAFYDMIIEKRHKQKNK